MLPERISSTSTPIEDRLTSRLAWAVAASFLVNLALWSAASRVISRHVMAKPDNVEVTRIFLPRPKPPVKPPRKVVKPIPKAKPHPVLRKPPPTPIQHPVVQPRPPVSHPAVRPQGAHNRVITAPYALASVTAAPGGQASVGEPMVQQPGSGRENVPNPAPPPSHPSILPETHADQPPPPLPLYGAGPPRTLAAPEHPFAAIAPRIALLPAPVHAAPAAPPAPRAPVGPTREAEPENQVNPEIPDSMKSQAFKSFVRVRVEIAADGQFTAVLRTSSGNALIDQRVLEALKQWKWKPALEGGRPVSSTRLFKFEFEVN